MKTTLKNTLFTSIDNNSICQVIIQGGISELVQNFRVLNFFLFKYFRTKTIAILNCFKHAIYLFCYPFG